MGCIKLLLYLMKNNNNNNNNMRLIKSFENFNETEHIELSDYFLGEPDKQYVDFESTHDPFETDDGRTVGLHHNSFSSFRKGNKSIKPTEDMVNDVVGVFDEILGDSINHYKYYPEFKQVYFYTWPNKQMSYGESSRTNKKKLIIDFYTNDWIFVSLCDENVRNLEKHSICKGLGGLREFLIDKKEYIITK